jgi:hypothetical protein
MLRRATFLMLLSVLVCTAASADWLLLRGGKKIETTGPWVTRGTVVTVHETSGRTQTLMLSIIDYDATFKANAHNPGLSSDGTVHVTGATVQALAQAARDQVLLAGRIKAQQDAELLAQMTGSKPGRVGAAGSTGFSSGALPFGKAGSPGKGFDAVRACAGLQDNVPAYNSCLNAYGH